MQVFPQLTPWNVWDVPLPLWATLAVMCDQWVADQKEAARRG